MPIENPNCQFDWACAGVAKNKRPRTAEAFSRFLIKPTCAIGAPPKKGRFQAFIKGVASDRERLSVLFDTHEDKLYRLARRLTASADQAEDLLQDTFLKAAGAIASIPVESPNAEAWLTRVLVNTRRDQWRKNGVRQRAAPLLQRGIAAPASDAESALITKRAVWAALDGLSPRRRAIVILSELDGMTPDAIAAVFGVASMTVRWHLSLARRELRRVLAPFMER